MSAPYCVRAARSQLLRQTPLQRLPQPLAAASRLRRAREYLPNTEGLEGAGDLPSLLVVGPQRGVRRAAEVAAAVGVQLAETAMALEHGLERHEGRDRAFLGKEAGVQDPAVGVVERDHQVALGLPRDPLVGRGVHVDEHAGHRPPLPASAVLAAPGRLLCQPRVLEHDARPRVRNLDAVLLRGLLVEVLNREVGVQVALEAAELLDLVDRDALAPRRAGAPVSQTAEAERLVAFFEPPHVSRGDAQNRRRLQPGDAPFDGFQHDFLAGHRLRLLGDAGIELSHPAALSPDRPVEADIFRCS